MFQALPVAEGFGDRAAVRGEDLHRRRQRRAQHVRLDRGRWQSRSVQDSDHQHRRMARFTVSQTGFDMVSLS